MPIDNGECHRGSGRCPSETWWNAAASEMLGLTLRHASIIVFAITNYSSKYHEWEKMLNQAPVIAEKTGIVAPNVRDLHRLAETLSGWLAKRLPGSSNIRITDLSYPHGAGMSHETILFDAHWTQSGEDHKRGMVVRIKPTSHTVYQDDMFEAQYEIMRIMHQSGHVRVAEPLWLEADAEILGAPFFVMAKMKGRVAVSYPPYSREGWLFDATEADQARAWENGISQLAAIQRVSISKLTFLKLPGEDGFDQETNRWRRYLSWIGERHDLPFLEEAWTILTGSLPANRPEGVVWGDARLGNMMLDDRFSVVAVMDWEQPSLGGALHDLGWWLFHDFMNSEGRGLPRLPGFHSREQTIAIWERESGLLAKDVDWYELFAAFKMACLTVRMIELGEGPKSGMDYGDNVMNRELGRRLGMKAPAPNFA